MEAYTFKRAVAQCDLIHEATACLEMFCYSDSTLNSVRQRSLEAGELEDFFLRRGAFDPTSLPDNVHPVAGLRLLLQLNAKHHDTFRPNVISMQRESYVAMVEAWQLPRIAIETSSVVGPFFWYTTEDDEDGHPCLQTVFRKSDIRKKGTTRGWELTLSHNFTTCMTTGFCKGTPSSQIHECIEQLKACVSDIGHPLLLPLIVFGHESSYLTDVKQRDAREWLRRLEHAISMRSAIDEPGGYIHKNGFIDLDAINVDLVECHSQVLWKRPSAYLAILGSLEEAAGLSMKLSAENQNGAALQKLHQTVTSRLAFYKKRWMGLQEYADTTMQRLEIQKDALYNVIAQKESRLNLEIARDQRTLASTSKRESKAMKGISLLGTIFLPGTFLSSIFSTTFFDFQDAPDLSSVVSPRFWLYWAVTVPFTLLVVALYFIWEGRRARRYEMEDLDLEESMENLEKSIMGAMRNRASTKVKTWTARKERQQKLLADEDNDYGLRPPGAPHL